MNSHVHKCTLLTWNLMFYRDMVCTKGVLLYQTYGTMWHLPTPSHLICACVCPIVCICFPARWNPFLFAYSTLFWTCVHLCHFSPKGPYYLPGCSSLDKVKRCPLVLAEMCTVFYEQDISPNTYVVSAEASSKVRIPELSPKCGQIKPWDFDWI